MPTTFVFVRHAQGYHNIDGEKRGDIAYNDPKHLDAELTPYGIQQARMNNLGNEKFDAIYCSPMRRCRHTLLNMYPISEKLNVILDDSLIEQPRGKFICDRRLEKYEIVMTTPMAWNTDMVSERNPFILNPNVDNNKIESFTKYIMDMHPNSKVLIVSHGVWIQNWLLRYNHEAKFLNNCEVVRVTL